MTGTSLDLVALRELARDLRLDILEMTTRVASGHVSSSYSAVEILTALYFGGILRYRPDQPRWPERDRFFLSKGHAAPLLYAVLARQPDGSVAYVPGRQNNGGDGYVIAQEYLPAAEQGDMRLFMMNGRPLRVKGKYAAFRRIRTGDDLRFDIRPLLGKLGVGYRQAAASGLSDDGRILVGGIEVRRLRQGDFQQQVSGLGLYLDKG